MAGTTLGQAYVQIVPSAKGISGSISKSLNGEASSAGSSAGSTIASKIKGAIAAAGIGAAVTTAFKASLTAGSELQQSLGGLDTLYGKSSKTAKGYASQAYKMGISMNDYAEQATSFGAALKSAYGGDTQKAAEAANTAISDMADNSAKMGTDMESIQNAYQGFAKGNYTMLDNLKLGYGGTKEEMQRLLDDAQKISGVKYDISNLGDVYDAIHVVQGELGLTGTASKEASTTFSGSLSAMKAAGTNLLANLALGKDITPSLNQLLSTAKTFFVKNFLPMVSNILNSLGKGIKTFIAKQGPKIVSYLQKNGPTLLKQGIQMATKFLNGLIKMLPSIIKFAGQMIAALVKAIIACIPDIVKSAKSIGKNFFSSLKEIIGSTALAKWGKKTIGSLVSAIKEKVEDIKEAARKIGSGFVEAIKSKFSLPTISLNMKTKTILGKDISYPTGFSIKWNKEGGIFDSSSIIGYGVGEAGAEAIVPLDKFWKKLDDMQGGYNFNVTVNAYGMDAKAVASEVETAITNKYRKVVGAW